jgi:type I restriction enzyme S subunit
MVPLELDGANLTQGTARLAPSSKAVGKYLFWSLQGARALDQITAACKGSTFREITLGRLRTLKIPLPPTREQQRIVAYLDGLLAKVDRLKAVQAQTRAELDALLPSILDRAFKGEL